MNRVAAFFTGLKAAFDGQPAALRHVEILAAVTALGSAGAFATNDPRVALATVAGAVVRSTLPAVLAALLASDPTPAAGIPRGASEA